MCLVLIMALVRPKVNLIKLSLNISHLPNGIENISKLSRDPKWLWCRESACASSFVFRHESGFIYQIFKSGHINLTNVRRVQEIEKAIAIIYRIIGIPKILEKEFRIDNIQATGRLNLYTRDRSLKSICDRLSQLGSDCNIRNLSFEPQRFPGAFIKYQDGNVKATIILFNSRRFVLVGLNSLDSVNSIHDWLERCIWRATEESNLREAGLPALMKM